MPAQPLRETPLSARGQTPQRDRLPLHQSHPLLPRVSASYQPVRVVPNSNSQQQQPFLVEPLTARLSPRAETTTAPPRITRSESHVPVVKRSDSKSRMRQEEQPAQSSPGCMQQPQQVLQQNISQAQWQRHELVAQIVQPVQRPMPQVQPEAQKTHQVHFAEAAAQSPRLNQQQEHLEQLQRLKQHCQKLYEQQQRQLQEDHSRDIQRVKQELHPKAQEPVCGVKDGPSRSVMTTVLETEKPDSADAKPDPFEHRLQGLPTAGRNKSRPESISSPRNSASASTSKLRATMGVFGVPEPPVPPAGAANSNKSAWQDPQADPATSFIAGSPSRGRRVTLTSEEATSFVLAQPPSMTPDRCSPRLRGNGDCEALDSITERVDIGASQKPAPVSDDVTPPSPPQRLVSNSSGSTCFQIQERIALASVASSVPSSIPGNATVAVVPTLSNQSSNRSLPIQTRRHPPVSMAGPPTQKRESHVSAEDFQSKIIPEIEEVALQVSIRDLSELRSFRKPPAVVCQVLEAIAVVLGIADFRWSSMRKQLDNSLIHRLSVVDPENLSASQRDRLRTLLQVPTFSDGSLSERCPAVAALAEWCNVVGYLLDGQLPRVHHVASLRQAPSMPDLGGMTVEPNLWLMHEDDLAEVQELTVIREDVGRVTFHGLTDCREIIHCLPEVVVLNPGEVVIYPNQEVKPPVGSGLNKPASIKLYGCHPRTQNFRDDKARDKYTNRVRLMTEEKGAEFIDYDCDQGIWQFRVAHF